MDSDLRDLLSPGADRRDPGEANKIPGGPEMMQLMIKGFPERRIKFAAKIFLFYVLGLLSTVFKLLFDLFNTSSSLTNVVCGLNACPTPRYLLFFLHCAKLFQKHRTLY